MKFDKRLLRLTGNIRLYLGITVGLALLTGLLTIAQAFALTRVIDGVFLGGKDLGNLGAVLLFLLIVIIARAALTWGSEVAANRAAAKVKTNLRERLFRHLLALGPSYTKGERSGELANTATEGIESLDAYFSQYLPQLFIVGLVPLSILITVFFLDPLSGVVLLVTAPILPFFMILIGKMAEALTKKQWKSLSHLSAHFLDVLQGLTTLKLFGRNRIQEANITRISEQFSKITLGVLRVAFLSALVLELCATISTAIIAVEIGLRLMYAQVSFDKALFVLLLAPEFYAPFRALGARFHAAMSGGQVAQRVFEILDTPLRGAHAGSQENLFLSSQFSVLSFENVTYAYYHHQDAPRPALKGVSFQLKPGEKVALVGPSGAGKSTIAHLLLRFIEPDGGQICLGEKALDSIPAWEWRKQVAWVPQNPYLFHATVAENIRLGKADATSEEIIKAAKLAHAEEFIRDLPQGYDTIIGERGARLSGGQAQRLSLARAFLKQAPLLVLDEATSSLDPEHEALVLEATERLMEGRTVLVIAHRLSTVYRCDRIVVLNEGRVVESGSHLQLLEQPGLYRQLVGAHGGKA